MVSDFTCPSEIRRFYPNGTDLSPFYANLSVPFLKLKSTILVLSVMLYVTTPGPKLA